MWCFGFWFWAATRGSPYTIFDVGVVLGGGLAEGWEELYGIIFIFGCRHTCEIVEPFFGYRQANLCSSLNNNGHKVLQVLYVHLFIILKIAGIHGQVVGPEYVDEVIGIEAVHDIFHIGLHDLLLLIAVGLAFAFGAVLAGCAGLCIAEDNE